MTLLFSFNAFHSYLLTERSCDDDDDDMSMYSPNCDALSNEEQNMSNLFRSFDDIQCELKKSYSHFNLRALWGIFMFSFFLYLRLSNGILIYWKIFWWWVYFHSHSIIPHTRPHNVYTRQFISNYVVYFFSCLLLYFGMDIWVRWLVKCFFENSHRCVFHFWIIEMKTSFKINMD